MMTKEAENLKKITSLAPKVLTDEKDIKKIQPYLSALKNAIDDNDISNIALTGAYGSGKSTIIRTFLDRNNNYKPLYISLATFTDEDSNDNRETNEGKQKKDANKTLETHKEKQTKATPEKTKNTERLIELSIIQQIFYHVKPSEIPDSRFKRIRGIGNKQLLLYSALVLLWLVSVLFLFKFNYISKLNPNFWNTLNNLDVVALLSFVTFFLGLGYAITKIIRFLNGTSVSKLNFLKGEMELGKNIEQSIFNQHLDEIIYFFEATNYNIVILEDLDRFKNTEIFTKLREINVLLNNSKSITRKIVFIYAIRDDKFHDKERIKFFDYIIPVIPFINPSNASDQLTKLIENAGSKDDFSPDFIDSVTTYIDDIDMRLLINIFHEYTIYKESLDRKLIHDNLMSIIIYKNLEPKDFVDLSKNQGVLYTFLSNDKKYIKELIVKLDEDAESKKQEILNIENEKVDNINELKSIYINALREMLENAITINIEGEFLPIKDLRKDDVFNSLIETENIEYETYTIQRGYSHYIKTKKESNKSFADVEKSVNSSFFYRDRAGFINDSNNNRINELKTEIESIRKRKREIESWSLKQIFTKVDISPYLTNFANSKLIRNLIINGYINKNYDHYITLFHEVNITQSDFDFERNIKNKIISPYNYKLYKVENLTKRIQLKYFGRKEILNFDLLAFLLSNPNIFPEKFKHFIGLLTNTELEESERKEIFSFIFDYLFDYKINNGSAPESKNIKLLISEISAHWDKFWYYIDKKSDLSTNNKDKLLKLIIKYALIEDIITISKNSELELYISNSVDFLSLHDKEDFEKVAAVLKSLNIKFKELTPPTEKTKKLFDYLYKNNHYQINEINLSLLLKINGNYLKESFLTSNYTSILKSEAKPLINYIQANINEYIIEVMLTIEFNIKENENVLLDIYNNSNINSELFPEIIAKQDTVIHDLSKLKHKSISPMFFRYFKIAVTWKNIFTYFNYSDESIDEVLVEYLNHESIYTELSNTPFQRKDDRFTMKFSLALIYCNGLTLKSYTSLLKCIPTVYSKWKALNFEDLNNDKVEWLIDNNFLTLSAENYVKLKEHFGLHVQLIERNQKHFFALYDNLILDDEDLLSLLNSHYFNKKNKLKLIERLEDDEITDNIEVAKKVCNILANSRYIPLSFSVLSSLVSISNSVGDKVKLVNTQFEYLSKTEIKTLFNHLPSEYKKTIQAYGKPSLPNTSFNRELADNLLKHDFISSRKIKNGKIRIYAFNSQ